MSASAAQEDNISIIQYIFPPRCALCNRLLPVGAQIYICEACAREIGYFNNRINPINLPANIETFCDGMICIGHYSDSLKASIRRFKFANKPSYFRAFGRLLAVKIQGVEQLGPIDLVIPVPLHKNKQKLRGYNQAELIAGYAARVLGVPMAANILIKSEETGSQSMLHRSERLHNLEDSFRVVNERTLQNKRILIVDDIVTTGSTINQCSKALKHAGALSVTAGVIATTRGMI